jgi:hypothetical protein
MRINRTPLSIAPRSPSSAAAFHRGPGDHHLNQASSVQLAGLRNGRVDSLLTAGIYVRDDAVTPWWVASDVNVATCLLNSK